MSASSSKNETTQQRQNLIDRHTYFMATAFLARERSKDPNYQVGACIVNKDNKIVSTGYNGMPTGCNDGHLSWERCDKGLYVCHAEINAITYRNTADLKGSVLYVTLTPCNECAKAIIQAGIAKVYYLSDEKAHKEKYIASKKMLELAGVELKKLIPKCGKIEIDFKITNLSYNHNTLSCQVEDEKQEHSMAKKRRK